MEGGLAGEGRGQVERVNPETLLIRVGFTEGEGEWHPQRFVLETPVHAEEGTTPDVGGPGTALGTLHIYQHISSSHFPMRKLRPRGFKYHVQGHRPVEMQSEGKRQWASRNSSRAARASGMGLHLMRLSGGSQEP